MRGIASDPELQRELEKLVDQHTVPGASAGVHLEGRTSFASAGVTSLDNPLPVTPGTLFGLNSLTKPVTATAFMVAADAGLLQLDAPLRTHLPALQFSDESLGRQLTARHLMGHTAGWDGSFRPDTGPGDDALQLLSARLDEVPFHHPPGEAARYDSLAFCILGRMLEVATGKVYEDAIRELVLAPLGMNSSFFRAGEVITRRWAASHVVGHDELVVEHRFGYQRSLNPAAGLNSTVVDLLRFARFHLADEAMSAPLMKDSSLAAMRAPSDLPWAPGYRFGLGWITNKLGDTDEIGHGGDGGHSALLTLIPQRKFAFAVLTNADSGQDLRNDFRTWALQHYLSLRG